MPRVPAATLDQAFVGKVRGAQISSVSGNQGNKVNMVLSVCREDQATGSVGWGGDAIREVKYHRSSGKIG